MSDYVEPAPSGRPESATPEATPSRLPRDASRRGGGRVPSCGWRSA